MNEAKLARTVIGGRLRKVAFLKGNLHAHSRLSDGVLAPAQVARRYRELGYDFLAFTDHRCFIGAGREQAYWSMLPQGDADFLILRGIEEEPEELGGRHVGFVYGDAEVLRVINHPSEYRMTHAEVLTAIKRVKAHAVEVTYHGQYFPFYDVATLGVPRIATDDAHLASEIGVSWIEVDAKRDADSILRAIKAGDFTLCVQGRRAQERSPLL